MTFLLHALFFLALILAVYAFRREWPRVLAALRGEEIPPKR